MSSDTKWIIGKMLALAGMMTALMLGQFTSIELVPETN